MITVREDRARWTLIRVYVIYEAVMPVRAAQEKRIAAGICDGRIKPAVGVEKTDNLIMDLDHSLRRR